MRATTPVAAVVVVGVIGWGCARTPRGEAQANVIRMPEARVSASTRPAGGTEETQMAWMVKESTLPKDFPPAGKVGVVMEKAYPAARVARVRAEDLEGAGMNGMFRPLFNHIESRHISMTSPVVMDLSEREAGKAESMAFVYGEPGIGAPGEAEGKVRVEDVGPMVVLSVALRGGYGESNFRDGEETLRAWLRDNPGKYEVVGPPRVLAYNSPFVPWFLKVSEVQIPVRRVADD